MFRIPSIHHYCNRWCERCTLRQLCGYYQAKHQGEEVSAEDWIRNLGESKASNVFEDLDLQSLEELPDKLKEKEQRGDFNPNLSDTIKIYDYWQSLYAEVLRSLDLWWEEHLQDHQAFIASVKYQRQYNAREVLLHYRNFIGPKLHRALGGRFDAGGVIPAQSDWNGSAKVVYLALDHIKRILPDLKSLERIGSLLEEWEQAAESLQNAIRMDFPKYMDFQRPGFDALSEGRV